MSGSIGDVLMSGSIGRSSRWSFLHRALLHLGECYFVRGWPWLSLDSLHRCGDKSSNSCPHSTHRPNIVPRAITSWRGCPHYLWFHRPNYNISYIH